MNQDTTNINVDQVLAHAAWNDSILQSYRGLFLTTQSLLVAIGTGLFGIAILADQLVQALLASSLLTVLAAMAVYFTWQVRALIVERRQRVIFLTRWLLEAEKNWPRAARHMTLFKFLQSQGLSQKEYWRSDALEKHLSELEKKMEEETAVEDLLLPNPPHTFFARDDIYIGVLFIWSFLLISSWVYTIAGPTG